MVMFSIVIRYKSLWVLKNEVFYIFCFQGLSLLLAMILKALGPHQYYDSDDDYASDRVPLLRNAVHPPPYVVGDPVYGSNHDAWKIRIKDQVKTL